MGIDITEFITGLVLLLVGGALGIVGTYLKRPLDTWLERRKKAREVAEAARVQAEEAAQQRQQVDQYAEDYRNKLVRELRSLRILDMVRPLDLEHTYVRVRIQEERPQRYADAEEMAALAQGDPNILFELSHDQLEAGEVESLSPEEALRRYRHVAVLGDPGAGKTTMLRYLCLLMAQGKVMDLPDLPILVALNRYASAGHTNLLDFMIADVAQRYGFQHPRPYLEKRLQEGSAALFFDGLDEVIVGTLEEAEASYRQAANEINRLSVRYPQCPIVVTSRRAGWKGLLAPTFQIMSSLDFNWEDMQCFIYNWFGSDTNRARQLKSVLAHQPRMQSLAANPLLLSLIAIVFQRDLELPERRAKLYERCVHVLLNEWDAHRGIKRAGYFTTDRKRDLLEDVALHFHLQGARYFAKEDLLEIVAAYLPTINIPPEQAPLILEEITSQHGLLKEQAAEWYGFLHLTLQEYMAAVSLDKGNQLELVLSHLHDPWWEEVTLLLAGMQKDAAPLLKATLTAREDIFYSNLLLSSRCLVGTPRIRQEGLRRQVIQALKSLVENEEVHWLPRTKAVQILGEIEREASCDYLLDLLSNHILHPRVRGVAAEVLGTVGGKDEPSRLLSLLPDEELDISVRQSITETLISLGDKTIVSGSLPMLVDDGIALQVRGGISRIVRYLGDSTITSSLFSLVSGSSPDLAWYAGRAIAYLRVIRGPVELRQYLSDQSLHRVGRWALVHAVEFWDKPVPTELIDWTSDTRLDESIRWSVVNRLGRLGTESFYRPLQRLYVDKQLSFSVRMAVGVALLDLGMTELADELKEALINPDVADYIRYKIADVLVRCRVNDTAKWLIGALLDEDLRLYARLKAAELLGEVSDATVAPQLLDFLRNEQAEAQLRARAADVLKRLELNQAALAEVKSLVVDESVAPLVRGRAAHALIQARDGVGCLLELLGKEELAEQVYLALYEAARRAGVRVFARPEGGYEVVRLDGLGLG